MKSKLSSLIQRTSLQQRFFISYCFVAVIILSIISTFFYNYTSSILLHQATSSMEERVETFSSQLDLETEKMQNIALNVSYSNLIKKRFTSYFSLSDQTQISRREDSEILMDMFVAINGPSFSVQQINIFNMEGDMVGSGLMNKTMSFNLETLPWYEKTLKQGGRMVLTTPYMSPIIAEEIRKKEYYLSLYMLYMSTYGQHLGFIEIIQDCDTLFKSMIKSKKGTSATSNMYVFNDEGILIFPYQSKPGGYKLPTETEANALYATFSKNASSLVNNATIDIEPTNQKQIVTYKKSDYNNWLILVTESESTVLRPVNDFTRLLFFMIFIILIVAISLSYLFSRRLTRPLKDLHLMIHQTELENLDHPEDTTLLTSYTELTEVHEAFITLKTKLKLSMDQLIESKQQETKALMQALQSLINPHFYFNSLSSILVMAEMQQHNEIISYCRNLSSIMRYITTNTLTSVPMATELDYVTRYLACMKVRYPSSLTYQLNVPTELEEIVIPKLIIQPLVENALKYGTDCEPPWRIEILGEITSKGWLLHVIDHGNGFSEEVISEFQKKMQTFSITNQIPSLQIDGMGLLNVYSRWQLFMGPEAFFKIGNHVNGGAIVTIGSQICSDTTTHTIKRSHPDE